MSSSIHDCRSTADMSDQQKKQRSASGKDKALETEPPVRAPISHDGTVTAEATCAAPAQTQLDSSFTRDAEKHDKATEEEEQSSPQNVPSL